MILKVPAIASATLLTAVLLGLVGTPTQAAATPRHQKPPPDSYLQYRVYSVDQLIQQVQNNPTVRERFARHFEIAPGRVVSYMRANLVESYIPVTRRYTVYCISRSGRIYALKQTFHKGTKVFALKNGQPVLKWLCGNPLSHFLPAVVTQTYVKKPKPIVTVSRSIQTLTENADVLVPNEVAATPFVPVVPFFPGGASSSFLSSASGGFPLAFLLPAALLFSNSGHGGGGGTVPHTTPPVVVPEPTDTLFLLGALPILGLGIVCRRRVSEQKHDRERLS